MRSTSRSTLWGLLLGVALLGGTACSEYHYYDITVTLDSSLTPSTIRGSIQRCNMTVTNEKGGEEDLIEIRSTDGRSFACPFASNSSGVIEYSTFKSSGSLTFAVTLYDSQSTTENCLIGSGTTTVDAKETTNSGTVTLTANGSDGCT